MHKLIFILALTLQVFAVANEVEEIDGEVCVDTCASDEFGATAEETWFCIAKDSCGKTYIPECGKECFDHAVGAAEQLCQKLSDSPESCKVISPIKRGGSCGTDRDALVRKAK